MSPNKPCRCHSQQPYALCCGPFHRGNAAPATPEALMRSRYAAYALGLGDYVYETLAQTHPDRQKPRSAMVARFSYVRDQQRFAGLRILYTSENEDAGEVLFFAKLYQRGANASFAELSHFVREGQQWRYATGQLLDHKHLPHDLTALTRPRFIELAAKHPAH